MVEGRSPTPGSTALRCVPLPGIDDLEAGGGKVLDVTGGKGAVVRRRDRGDGSIRDRHRPPSLAGACQYPGIGPCGLDVEVEEAIGKLGDQAVEARQQILAPPPFGQLLDPKRHLRHGDRRYRQGGRANAGSSAPRQDAAAAWSAPKGRWCRAGSQLHALCGKRFSSMAASRSMPGRVMRMNQSGKRSPGSPAIHSFAVAAPLENGPDLRLEAALLRTARCRRRSGGVGQFSDASWPFAPRVTGSSVDITAIARSGQARFRGGRSGQVARCEARSAAGARRLPMSVDSASWRRRPAAPAVPRQLARNPPCPV